MHRYKAAVAAHSTLETFAVRWDGLLSLDGGRSAVVLVLAGRLDGNAQVVCDSAFASHVAEGRTYFVLDCEELEFISSAGVRCIIKLTKGVRPAGGMVIVCRPREMVRQLLGFTGLGDLLPTAKDRVSACAMF